MTCPDANLIVEFAEARLNSRVRGHVLRHLEACRRCTALVAEAAQAESSTTGEAGAGPADNASMPHTLDRYVVLGELGRGGMGTVYAAFDPILERQVAVKLLHATTVGDAARRHMFRELLVREARAMARLSHPNVVAVYDVIVWEEQVGVVMEQIRGGTVRQHFREHPARWRAIRDAFVAAGRGLSAAHEVGIVHRDFKPSNVLVSDTGRVCVSDFGLARLGDDPRRGSPSSPHRDAGVSFAGGTPGYMAPEQASGADVDARADQYSFCVTLYEALYGQRPDEAHPNAGVRGALGPVPAWIGEVLARGLQPQPHDRFADIDALLVALRRDARSRRRSVAGLTMVALLSAAGTWGATRADDAETAARLEDRVDVLAQEVAAAARDNRFIYPSLDDPSAPTAFAKLLELEALAQAGATTAEARARDLRGDLGAQLSTLGDQYWDAPGERGFANDFYAWALIFQPDNPTARERLELTPGELATLRGRAERTEFSAAELRAAQPAAALAGGDEAEAQALLRRRRGTSASARDKQAATRSPAAAPAPPAEAATRDGGPGERPSTSRSQPPGPATVAVKTLTKRGREALARGDLRGAMDSFHAALGQSPKSFQAALGLSNAYYEEEQYRRAQKYAAKAVALAPASAAARVQLGDCYYKLHRLPQAREQYERADALGHKAAPRRLKRLRQLVGAG